MMGGRLHSRPVNLRSPSTLVEAWILLPALVVAASAALGWLLGRLTRADLGALTLPAGFLAGVGITSALLSLGLSGKLSVVVVAALALVGAVLAVLDLRRRGTLPAIGAAALWPAGAFVAAYCIAMAPLVGTGYSAMLGYQLNGDPAAHITLVEEIAQHSAHANDPFRDSVHAATRDLEAGYPLGSYAWPLFGRVLTGVDVFHLWTPLSAVVLALMALVSYALLRTLAAPRAFAAAAGTLAAVGYLVYSYHVQGGTKEVLLPLATYGAVALAVVALARPLTRLALVPAAVAAGAAVADLGYGGLAWVAPAGLVVAGVLAWRAWRAGSSGGLVPLIPAAGVGLLLALPNAVRTVSFFRENNGTITGAVGNLVGAVPFREAFNVWLAHDYRLPATYAAGLSPVGVWLGAVACLVGAVWALRRRNLAIPLALVAGIGAVVIVTPKASIYYDAKTYVAAAPALALASAAGVLALARAGGALRIAGVAAGALLAAGAIASDAYVYSGAWVTPRYRFQELAQVADRTRGQGPLLIDDYEQWAPYILRDSRPWIEHTFRVPYARFSHPGNIAPVRPLDPDDYALSHIEMFPLVLVRRDPYGSRPPSNYAPVFETKRYVLWRRTGPAPRMHLPSGSDGYLGAAPLVCRGGVPARPSVRALLAAAGRLRVPVRAALAPPAPVVAIPGRAWAGFRKVPLFKPKLFLSIAGGSGSGYVEVRPGSYYAWIAGSLGPGIDLYARPIGQAGFARVGSASDDMGLPALWQPIGVAQLQHRTVIHVTAAHRAWWRASSRHPNIVGPVVFTRVGDATRVVQVPAPRVPSLCGRRIDWLEI
jgi:hypothetical protein